MLKGTFLIFIVMCLLWIAYNNANKPTRAFWAILALGFVLRLFVSLDPFLHDWDERYHALVAKNLMHDMLQPLLHKAVVFNFDFKDWTNNHIWLHKPPLSLWFMAISMKLFGVNELAMRLPSLVVSTLSLVLTYKIATRLYPENKMFGVMAMFFQSVNGFVIEISAGRIPTDHVDTLLLFWIELGVWIAIKNIPGKQASSRLFLIVLITSFAILTKWFVALFIPLLWFLFEFISKKASTYICLGRFFVASLCSMMLPAAWAMYLVSNYPMEFSWEQSLNARHFYEVIEGHSGAWWYYLDKARINWNEGIYAIFALFVYKLYANRNHSDAFILAWMVIPYVLFSAFATKMNGYVLISAPAIFILIGKFVVDGWSKNTNTWRVLAGVAVLLALRYCMERVKPFYQNPEGIAQIELIKQVKSATPDNNSAVVFNNPYYIETMFYTNMVSMRGIPTNAETDLAKKHYKSLNIISNGDHLPDWILRDSAIQVIQVSRN